MKALKIIAVILILLVAAFLIVPLFLASEVSIPASVHINAAPATAFRQVNNLHNWNNWSPFHAADTAMAIQYEGPDHGQGASMQWTSDVVGNGTLTIVKSKPYTYQENNIQFTPDRGTAIGQWSFKPSDGGVDVQWTVVLTNLNYPMGRYMGLMAGAGMKSFLKQGLDKLKSVSERMPVRTPISVVNVEAIPSVSLLDSTTVDGIGAMLGTSYGSLVEYAMSNGANINGFPYAIYYNWDPQGVIKIRAALPVDKELAGKGTIEYTVLPACKAVYARHTGGYDTSRTHESIEEYLKQMQLECAPYIWEVYVTDPETEPDSTKWITDIYYPLK